MGSRDQGLSAFMSLGLFTSPSPLAAPKSPTRHCSATLLEHFGTSFFSEKPHSPSSRRSSFIPPACCCAACPPQGRHPSGACSLPAPSIPTEPGPTPPGGAGPSRACPWAAAVREEQRG